MSSKDPVKKFAVEPARSALLSELWQLQLNEQHISKESIKNLSQSHQLSEIEVEGVATFYHFFHQQPTGKYTIYLNSSIISELKGFERIKETFERETGARLGSTDPTSTFGLYATPCIGLSDHEPAALINFYPFTNLNALKVKEIINKLKQGKKPEDICDAPTDNIRYTPSNNRSIFFAPYTRGEAIEKLKSTDQDQVIELLRISELAGRGGAFFRPGKNGIPVDRIETLQSLSYAMQMKVSLELSKTGCS